MCVRHRLRETALLVAGALSIHQLRYMIAPGADGHLPAGRHAYLSIAVPVAGLLVAAVLAQLLVLAASARPARAGRQRDSHLFLWLRAAAVLLALYAIQEATETLLTGGPVAVLALFGAGASGGPSLLAHGGWVIGPLATTVAALVALGLRADEARPASGESPVARPNERPAVSVLWQLVPVALVWCGVLARHLAGRSPPNAFAD